MLAESATIGTGHKSLFFSCARICWAHCTPSSPGICRSNSSRSKRSIWLRYTASSPVSANTTLCPSRSKATRTSSKLLGTSSTAKTRSRGSRCAKLIVGCSSTCGFSPCKSGSLTVNTLPLPKVLRTLISPRINSTSWREIVVPKPVPPNFRLVEASACENGEKICSSLSGAMPIPVSSTLSAKTPCI